MRIAFLTVGDPARLTGGYLYHREVFARLRARGVTVTEFVASGADLAAQLAAAPGLGARFDPAPFDVVVVDALACAVCAPWLDRWRARRPLVAMVHELPSVAAGENGNDRASPPHLHTSTPPPSWEAPLLRADRLIAVSEDGARLLVERGVARERIIVASGGYDRLPRRPAAPAGPPWSALCVAQWIPRKGVLELARAWGRVARPGWRLELAGEPDADPAYGAAVRAALALAPPGSVAAHGPLSDAALSDAYARAAFFALPSRYEGYGLVFAEALAAGLPVLACAVGPLPELVGPDAGLLVPPHDDAALDAALARLMDDAALRERMALAAQARVAALPAWEGCAAAFLGALEAAIAVRKRA
ncbi:MAG: glycosyltransferase family 4 protein [Oscillochloridaceae bacterium]|nr:glycosyltransferase family 4 protein [Chloroflexaceae bacterium]MDW8388918.1 glycosyltransferase family 4 protein [Oscillochloridaceae bacterium]